MTQETPIPYVSSNLPFPSPVTLTTVMTTPPNPVFQGQTLQDLEAWNAQRLSEIFVKSGGNPNAIQPYVERYGLSNDTIALANKVNIPAEIKAYQDYITRSNANRGGNILDTILGDFGRGLTALFTVGLSEIPVGNKRVGEVSRIEPFVSTTATGGFYPSGVAKSERPYWQYGGMAITSASVGAAAGPILGAGTAGLGPTLASLVNRVVSMVTGFVQQTLNLALNQPQQSQLVSTNPLLTTSYAGGGGGGVYVSDQIPQSSISVGTILIGVAFVVLLLLILRRA